MTRLHTILKVALAWLPFYALWVLFILTYADEPNLGSAIRSGAMVIGWAAILGFGAWRFTAHHPWPESIRLRFYLLHLVAGSLFAMLWASVEYAFDTIRTGESFFRLISQSNVIGWQLLTGLWIYGLVAGVSYSVRIRGRLRDQERIAAQAESLAVEAQLTALRAQLNPHFLFNALHSVATLIRHNPKLAQRAVDQLGDLLRYALDEVQGDRVLLADEWSFTQDYLDLQRIRFGDNLQVDASLSSESLACLVPPFSLQPLVENAVQHGLAPLPRGGCVSIRGAVRNERLTVTVADDGRGAVDENTRAGHGMGALRERLRAMYGDRASLTVETRPDAGFTAVLSLPAVSNGQTT